MAPEPTNVLVLKGIAFAVILVMGYLFAWLPRKFLLLKSPERYLSMANCFTAGIFLGAGILHLLAEALELFEPFSEPIFGGYPFISLLSLLSFLFIFYLEHVLLKHHHHDDGHGKTENVLLPGDLLQVNDPKFQIRKLHEEEGVSQGDHPNEGIAEEDSGEDNTEGSEIIEIVQFQRRTTTLVHRPVMINGLEKPFLDHKEKDQVEEEEIVKHVNVVKATPVMAYMVAVILSIHSLIAGLALGAGVAFDTTLVLVFAIISHKWSEAFAVGVSLVRNEGSVSRKAFFVIVSIYALMTPLGIGLGAIVDALAEGEGTQLWVNMVFSALAAGTFIYVGTIEILPREFVSQVDKHKKFLLVMLGFSIMAVAKIYDSD